MKVLNLVGELAREHKLIKGFRYNRAAKKGAGNDMYPLVWLDDPIQGRSNQAKQLIYIFNVDILGVPQNDTEVEAVQDSAFVVGLSFAERMRTRYKDEVSIESYSFISLRDYYDDKAAGYRFTFNISAANPVNRCAEYFDPDKQLEKRTKSLPEFETDDATGCAIFSNKSVLPNFEL